MDYFSTEGVGASSLRYYRFLSGGYSIQFAIGPTMLRLFLIVISSVRGYFSSGDSRFVVCLLVYFYSLFFHCGGVLYIRSSSVGFLYVFGCDLISLFFRHVRCFLGAYFGLPVIVQTSLWGIVRGVLLHVLVRFLCARLSVPPSRSFLGL